MVALSHLIRLGLIEAEALKQKEVFEAAITFARSEGFIPAPESFHAVCAAIAEARKSEDEGRERVILFNLSGHGHFDMAAYDAFLDGTLEDFFLPEEQIQSALREIAELPKP